MALLTIPKAFRTPHQTQITTLDGRRYRLSFDWIQRIQRWTVSLETEAGDALLSCKGLALKADVLRQIRADPRSPPGFLTVVDLEDRDLEPTLESLGRRHRILYFEAAPT